MKQGLLRGSSLCGAFALGLLLSACQTTPGSNPGGETSLTGANVSSATGSMGTVVKNPDAASGASAGATPSLVPQTSGTSVQTRTVPRIGSAAPRLAGGVGTKRPRLGDERLTVALPPQSVPEFVNSVFGEILGLGFVLGPSVSEMDSVVAFRSTNDIRQMDLYESAIAALETYGVAVYMDDEGQLRVVLEDELRQQAPRFIRSRARRSVPTGLRPVVQFVDLFAISADEMTQILNQSFPEEGSLVVRPNPAANTMTLTGLPADVDRALSIINQMDELRFGGQSVATIRVENWEVGELAQSVFTLLQTEGYSVTSNPSSTRPITLRTIPFTNQLVIFASDQSMLDYAVQTALRLDQAAVRNEEIQSPRIYQAQYYRASELIQLISSVLDRPGESDASGPGLAPQQVAVVSSTPDGDVEVDAAQSGSISQAGFVPDEQSNRIIFNATDDQYQDTLALLRQIDTPPPEVLIEVTIAEITLTANTLSGVEFLLNQIGSRGFSIGTRGGLGLATGGLSGTYQSGDVTVDFGAFSDNNLIQVLSTPRVVTKSGAGASISVGTEVPIITSQTAAPTQIGGTSDILQSVEYRQTGIILDVAPIVLSADRIDLEISQEVSSAEDNPNQSIGSPIISNRSITSQLTLQDGQSAILGGLIENRFTEGGSGVPFLKDVPVIGRLFSTETLRNSDTILLVMITPYILDTAEDRARAVDTFSSVVNDSFTRREEAGETLTIRENTPVVVTRSPVVIER